MFVVDQLLGPPTSFQHIDIRHPISLPPICLLTHCAEGLIIKTCKSQMYVSLTVCESLCTGSQSDVSYPTYYNSNDRSHLLHKLRPLVDWDCGDASSQNGSWGPIFSLKKVCLLTIKAQLVCHHAVSIQAFHIDSS